MMTYNEVDLTGTDARVFVVGDVHGHFTLLEQKLKEVGFDKSKDRLFSVGDLVDRGPESVSAVDYVAQPWFDAVRGNHEEMLLPATAATDWHVRNGGGWFDTWLMMDKNEARKAAAVLTSLPLAMLVTLPDGRKMGLCHASLPAAKHDSEVSLTDWNDVAELAAREKWPFDENPFLWDRDQVYRAQKLMQKSPEYRSERKLREFNPDNVDLVFFGHTPMKEPLTVGKCTWLDTGAFATGNLTLKEV